MGSPQGAQGAECEMVRESCPGQGWAEELEAQGWAEELDCPIQGQDEARGHAPEDSAPRLCLQKKTWH